MSTFSSRLEAVLKHLGIPAYKMAKDLGVTVAGIGNFRAIKTNPSFDFLEKFLTCFPIINANWLIVNKGLPQEHRQSNKRLIVMSIEKQKESVSIFTFLRL